MTGNNNIYKTIWINEKEEYDGRYIYCFFTAITYKCGQVVLFCSSVYFVSANSYCYFPILFMYNALYFATFIFILHIPCFPFFLIDHNEKQVLLIKWVVFFFKLKNILFVLFNFLKIIILTTYFDVDQRCEIRRWK